MKKHLHIKIPNYKINIPRRDKPIYNPEILKASFAIESIGSLGSLGSLGGSSNPNSSILNFLRMRINLKNIKGKIFDEKKEKKGLR
jgi:hypothetical protein